MKKITKTNKKTVGTLVIVGALVSSTLMGTLAWLSAKSELTNIFVVGQIDKIDENENGPVDPDNPYVDPDAPDTPIDIPTDNPETEEDETAAKLTDNLMEPNWTPNSKLVPGNTIAKDPYVGVGEESEASYAYLYVSNTMPTGEAVYFSINDGWTCVEGTEVTDTQGNVIGYADGLFRYNSILETEDGQGNVWTAKPLFYNVKVSSDATKEDLVNVDTEGNEIVGSIKVESYVHQAFDESLAGESKVISVDVVDVEAKTAFGMM